MQINYPFHFDGRGRTALTTQEQHINHMIEQVLLTNPGERVNRPDFGSGALQLVFAPNSPELAAALQFTLNAALQQYLGDVIEVQALNVSALDEKFTIEIVYIIRRTGQSGSAEITRTVSA